MTYRQLRAVEASIVAALAVAVVAGCAATPPAADSAQPTEASSPTPALSPTPTPQPDPLLVISGTVADQQGQSLALTLTTTSVRPPTDDDRADYGATRCAAAFPEDDPFAAADTRVVTLAVEAVGSAGFSGWTDARGVRVAGSLFDGPIWESEAHGATDCYQDSRITRPGSGEVRLIVSSADWNLPREVVDDEAITLASYGFEAVSVDALGQPTGLTSVAGCLATPSPEFDDLALTLWSGRWGANNNLPEYCFYGRSAGD